MLGILHRTDRGKRIRLILAAYSRGENTRKIAARFGVSLKYPRLIASRRGLPARPNGRPRTAQ